MAREVMFVGSVPLRPADKVFEALGKHIGELAPRYPDGEQAGWLATARKSFPANPALEPAGQVPLEGKGSRLLDLYQLKAGCKPSDLVLGPYGYGKNAVNSYREFKRLKNEGKVPAKTRFTATMPGPGTATFVLRLPGEELLPIARQAIWKDIEEVLAAVPHDELAIQLDLGMEAEHEEYLRRPDAWDQPVHKVFHWTLDQMAESAAWVANRIPAEVQLGFHICSIWHHDVSAGQDNNVLVDAANAVLTRLKRPVTYIHIPTIPEHSQADYDAFKRLKLPQGAKLFIGLLNLADGLDGARKRIALAQKSVPEFGIAMFCGLGHAPTGPMGMAHSKGLPVLRRATPDTLDEVLKLHREAANL
jgi:hypothetical protein